MIKVNNLIQKKVITKVFFSPYLDAFNLKNYKVLLSKNIIDN